MKKILSVILALIMCMSFASCEKRPDAKEDLTTFFEAMKAFDAEVISKYLQDSEFDATAAVEALEATGFDYKLLTKNLEYEILECAETENTAEAKVKISNISFEQVLADAIPYLMPIVLDPKLQELDTPEFEAALEPELIRIITELLTEGEYEKYEETVNIKLRLGEECWQIENTGAIIRPLIGGIDIGDIGLDIVG